MAALALLCHFSYSLLLCSFFGASLHNPYMLRCPTHTGRDCEMMAFGGLVVRSRRPAKRKEKRAKEGSEKLASSSSRGHKTKKPETKAATKDENGLRELRAHCETGSRRSASRNSQPEPEPLTPKDRIPRLLRLPLAQARSPLATLRSGFLFVAATKLSWSKKCY